MLVTWLNNGTMDYYYYTIAQEREAVTLMYFLEAYCKIMNILVYNYDINRLTDRQTKRYAEKPE